MTYIRTDRFSRETQTWLEEGQAQAQAKLEETRAAILEKRRIEDEELERRRQAEQLEQDKRNGLVQLPIKHIERSTEDASV